ncbi:carboxylesterase/lipase family protein [Neobacillus vireti]|uniref:carboxylesterase/lipase family protein n=1 Tax=Neobacillus vireti TaxID=220686 RepID=UPI002FFDE3C6
MKKWLGIFFVFTLLFTNQTNRVEADSLSGSNSKTTIISTKYGKVEGLLNETNSTLTWLGVPYAKPPLGSLRWKAPAEPDSWDGILETKKFGQVCTQQSYGAVIGSEDCLTLNIWRPNSTDTNLPVMVFVHGGGDTTGSSQSFKGDVLAQKANSIIISINYRLNAEGWFMHPSLKTGNPLDDSGNFGLLDIFQSLKWVQKNIEYFGGNPNNVTLSGQSAGARDVLGAVISPLSKGLFQKAWAMSGGMTTASPKDAEDKAQDMLVQLVINDKLATNEKDAKTWIQGKSTEFLANYLRSKGAKELTNLAGSPPIKMEPFPHLFADGFVLPAEGFKSLKNGNYNKVPIVLGSTASEFSLFAFQDPYFLPSILDGSIYSDNKKWSLYENTLKFGNKLYAGFNADAVADQIVNVKDQPGVYAYRFAWGTQEGVIDETVRKTFGAPHGSDIDFFTGLDESWINLFYPNKYYTVSNEQGRRQLHNTMVSYLKNFLYTGNPNGEGLPQWGTWSNKDNQNRILYFDADQQNANVYMSDEHLVKNEIVNEMRRNLPKQEYDTIVEQLFAGRFFWEK